MQYKKEMSISISGLSVISFTNFILQMTLIISCSMRCLANANWKMSSTYRYHIRGNIRCFLSSISKLFMNFSAINPDSELHIDMVPCFDGRIFHQHIAAKLHCCLGTSFDSNYFFRVRVTEPLYRL